MPAQPTYPGVYVEEIPSGVRTITGVSTSIAAFIGYFKRGPMNHAVQIFNFGDFERIFGGLDLQSEASYAIQQFFLNGGSQAHVIRVAAGTPAVATATVPGASFSLQVREEGLWGDSVKVAIDHQTGDADLFNMTVTEYDALSGRVVQQEVFRNLSIRHNSAQRNFAWDVINDQTTGSKLVAIPGIRPAADYTMPTANGTVSDVHAGGVVNINTANFSITVIEASTTNEIELTGLTANGGGNYHLAEIVPKLEAAIQAIDNTNPVYSAATVAVNAGAIEVTTGGTDPAIQFRFSGTTATGLKLDDANADFSTNQKTISDTHADNTDVALAGPTFTISVNTSQNYDLELEGLVIGNNNELDKVARSLEDALRAANPADRTLANATVNVVGDRLQVLAGGNNTAVTFTFSGGVSTNLLFNSVQPQAYSFTGGANGTLPDAAALIGKLNNKSGMFALEDVDLFNILCIPRTGSVVGANAMTTSEAQAVLSAAINYCESKRAFLIIDTPQGTDELSEIKTWMTANGGLRHKNAALYYPRVMVPDALDNFRLRDVGACGTMAGLYARIDANRGVWKAPAGTEASLRNVSALTDVLSDQENGVLNPLGVNCLVNKPVYGNISWGGRTLEGADQMASEWKYIPVRRLALFMEESLFRGLQWAVFEPNDEPLWGQIRLNVGAFMNNLFKQGAFQGSSPRDAYLVKCDKETTTQNDINLGIVNIVVGFAPLKPAEFVIIKIQQLAGQVQV